MDTLDDPYEGQLDRLQKLTGHLAHLTELSSADPAKLNGVIFAIGILRDIVENDVRDMKREFPNRDQ